jgi:hypothetical protein
MDIKLLKMAVSVVLMAAGMNMEDIFSQFGDIFFWR